VAWTLEFFETERGTSPPSDFIESLPAAAQVKLGRAIELLRELGPRQPSQFVKRLVGWRGLYELRVVFRGNAYRMFFFDAGQGRLVAVHGIAKKTDRIPRRDLETAAERRETWLRRR